MKYDEENIKIAKAMIRNDFYIRIMKVIDEEGSEKEKFDYIIETEIKPVAYFNSLIANDIFNIIYYVDTNDEFKKLYDRWEANWIYDQSLMENEILFSRLYEIMKWNMYAYIVFELKIKTASSIIAITDEQILSTMYGFIKTQSDTFNSNKQVEVEFFEKVNKIMKWKTDTSLNNMMIAMDKYYDLEKETGISIFNFFDNMSSLSSNFIYKYENFLMVRIYRNYVSHGTYDKTILNIMKDDYKNPDDKEYLFKKMRRHFSKELLGELENEISMKYKNSIVKYIIKNIYH